jgi:uncharacterized protein
MWAPVAEVAFLGAAGILSGVASASGAIGSLISYPALLAVGIPALPANVTNAVAVVGTGLGSTLNSRPELRGAGSRVLRWSAFTSAGAAGGAALLLLTPGGYFVWIVPFLIASAALLLLAQPRITAWRQARPGSGHGSALPYGLIAVGVYDGYFGAASGVMTLALLMLTVESQLVRANAYKNAILGVADVLVAVAFAIFGPVHWVAALALGIGFMVGGALGPPIARRVPAEVWRVVIAAAGLGLALWLLISAVRG